MHGVPFPCTVAPIKRAGDLEAQDLVTKSAPGAMGFDKLEQYPEGLAATGL